MSPAKRRWLRKHPAPPGPEPGLTFYTVEDFRGVKPATPEDVQRSAKVAMDRYDELPKSIRMLVATGNTGELPKEAPATLTKQLVCAKMGIADPGRARVSPQDDGTYRVYHNGRFIGVYNPENDDENRR